MARRQIMYNQYNTYITQVTRSQPTISIRDEGQKQS